MNYMNYDDNDNIRKEVQQIVTKKDNNYSKQIQQHKIKTVRNKLIHNLIPSMRFERSRAMA